MKCDECGEETDETVCRECGLVINIRPLALNNNGYPAKRGDVSIIFSPTYRSWSHPLSPNIRSSSRAFRPRYQKKYVDYVYIKAYESITKICAQLKLSQNIRFEALNLFKGIRKIEPDFFQSYKLAPTYLACIKIACKINDFPISNYELAKVVDYQSHIDKKNISYMEKKFNNAYRAILRLYKLHIKLPEHPHFIDFACNKLDLPYIFTKKIHDKYTLLKKYFQPHFRIEGYILALIYIYGNKDFGFYLKTIEELFHTSSKTITNRKNELLKYESKIMQGL